MPRAKKTTTQQTLPDKTPITELTVRDFYAGVCMAMLLQDVMKLPSSERPMMGDIADKSFEMADVAIDRRKRTPTSMN